MHASHNGHTALVQLLLGAGANKDAKNYVNKSKRDPHTHTRLLPTFHIINFHVLHFFPFFLSFDAIVCLPLLQCIVWPHSAHGCLKTRLQRNCAASLRSKR